MYARTVYAKQNQKNHDHHGCPFKMTTGVNATSRSDGVPNVADEEPGVCFGKIHSR